MFLLVIIGQVLSFGYVTYGKDANPCLSINYPNGYKKCYFDQKKKWEDS